MSCRGQYVANQYQSNAIEVDEHYFPGVMAGSAAMRIWVSPGSNGLYCLCGKYRLAIPASEVKLAQPEIDPEVLKLLQVLRGERHGD